MNMKKNTLIWPERERRFLQTTETVSFPTLLNGRYIVLQVYFEIIVQLSSLIFVDRAC